MDPAQANVAHIEILTHRAASGLRKCGAELPKIMTALLGTQRRTRWQRTRGTGRLELSRFAFMLADEKLGRG